MAAAAIQQPRAEALFEVRDMLARHGRRDVERRAAATKLPPSTTLRKTFIDTSVSIYGFLQGNV